MTPKSRPPTWRENAPDLYVASTNHIKRTLSQRQKGKVSAALLQMNIDQFKLRLSAWRCPTCHDVIGIGEHDPQGVPIGQHVGRLGQCSGRLEPLFHVGGVEWL